MEENPLNKLPESGLQHPAEPDIDRPAPAERTHPTTEPAKQVRPRPAGQQPEDPTSALSRVYGRALLELAQESGQLDALADEADELHDLIASQPELRHILSSPALNQDERRETLERIFQGRISDTLYRFLQVVNGKGRASSIPVILESFQDEVTQARGIVEADAFVPQRLSDEQARQVAQALSQGLGGKQVVLHQYIQPDLIGGIKLRVGDQLIDASVASQLRLMRERLIDAGRQAARRGAAQAQGSSEQGTEGPREGTDE